MNITVLSRRPLARLRSLAIKVPDFGRVVATTAVCNVAATAMAGIAGIVIARSLGPIPRGEYAAVFAWFSVVLVVGQVGQNAATTYFVARAPNRAPDYVATARTMMVLSGTITLGIGLVFVPLLAHQNAEAEWGFRLMFGTCIVAFVSAGYTFSLLGSSVGRWNAVRLTQPLTFAIAVVVLLSTQQLTLKTALVAMTSSFAVQGAFAYVSCRTCGLTGGRTARELLPSMTRYGFGQLAAAIPALATTRLDQLVLSLAVTPAALGHYAVAASLSSLAMPIVAAAGYVAFPRLASQALSQVGTARLQRWSILASTFAGVSIAATLVVSAPWLIPALFGNAFREAVNLVWLLAPGGVCLACVQVCGDLLRGHGKPFAAARAQGAGALTMIALLAMLVPSYGAEGAAIGSTAAAFVTLCWMLWALRAVNRPRHAGKSSVLLLAPSRGLGGGIERYVATIEGALRSHLVPYTRMDLRIPGVSSGLLAKMRFVKKVRQHVKYSREPVFVVSAHCHLLMAIRCIAGLPAFAGGAVVIHGSEVMQRRIRGRSAMRRSDIRVVAGSSYLAGIVAPVCPATVLHPGVDQQWFNLLVQADSARWRRPIGTVRVMTAFRFEAWQAKGLLTILRAIELLADERVSLTVCGTGHPSADILDAISKHQWCTVVSNPSATSLAQEYANADVVVLATSAGQGRRRYGEGFGLVLLEAQLAGTVVIAPPHGGGREAFQHGLTGFAAPDDSPEGFAAALSLLIRDDDLRRRMGAEAARWSRARFEPSLHAADVIRSLLGSDRIVGRSQTLTALVEAS